MQTRNAKETLATPTRNRAVSERIYRGRANLYRIVGSVVAKEINVTRLAEDLKFDADSTTRGITSREAPGAVTAVYA